MRSKDLAHWEESPVGGDDTIIMGLPYAAEQFCVVPLLFVHALYCQFFIPQQGTSFALIHVFGCSDGDDLNGPDHTIIPGSLLDEYGTAAEKAFCHNETDDINRSDMDMVTLPNGQTYVSNLLLGAMNHIPH